jgi:hypothetical protein
MWPLATISLSDQAAPGPSLEQFQRRERRFTVLAAAGTLGATALAVLLFVVAKNPVVGAGVIGGLLLAAAVVIWLWKAPVRGVYVLFGAAALLATYVQPGLTDYIGGFLPFFRDIKSYTNAGLVFSVGEVFITLVFLVWVLKGVAERDLRFDRGSLMLPIGLYALIVLFAEVHGVTSGGDFKTSLFELRSQVYMVIAYVLVCNLVKTRAQITKLLWILLVAAALRGIEGTIQYLFVLRAEDISTHELYPHEQSYFFNGYLTLTLIIFLYGGSRRMKHFTLLFLPFIVVADLANNRRASIAALAISILALLVITWVRQPRYRRTIGAVLLFLVLVYPPYFVAYENHTGLLALPARAIASSFHPNANDSASNQYRVFENLDIITTVKSSTTTAIIGYGFGKPMLSPYYLPNINYVFQYIMPHNSILWVWMRLGTIGFLVLWLLIGMAVVQVTQLMGRLRDPYLQGIALFVLLLLLQQVIISYVDLQWSNYRTMIVTGVLFALISRLAWIAVQEERAKRAAPGGSTRFPPGGHVERRRLSISPPGDVPRPHPAAMLVDSRESQAPDVPPLYVEWMASVARLTEEARGR